MPTTDLSIGRDPVVDFSCSGWPEAKRDELKNVVGSIPGVTRVSGAGISTIRIGYDDTSISTDNLILAVNRLADGILPGHNFTDR